MYCGYFVCYIYIFAGPIANSRVENEINNYVFLKGTVILGACISEIHCFLCLEKLANDRTLVMMSANWPSVLVYAKSITLSLCQ